MLGLYYRLPDETAAAERVTEHLSFVGLAS